MADERGDHGNTQGNSGVCCGTRDRTRSYAWQASTPEHGPISQPYLALSCCCVCPRALAPPCRASLELGACTCAPHISGMLRGDRLCDLEHFLPNMRPGSQHQLTVTSVTTGSCSLSSTEVPNIVIYKPFEEKESLSNSHPQKPIFLKQKESTPNCTRLLCLPTWFVPE